jgi:uncharacterized protein
MSLQLQLQEDMKQAMRARDALRLGVIRFLKSEIKNAEIDAGVLDDVAVQRIVSRQIKQIQDAIGQFEQGNRQELADEEKRKIVVLQEYLPAQLSTEELRAIITQAVAMAAEPSLKTVMPIVLSQVAGKAESRLVVQLVQEALRSSV